MYAPKFVNFISRYKYNSAMIDGNLNRTIPPKATIIKQFFAEYLKIDTNTRIVLYKGSYLLKEDRLPSTVNIGLIT
jgi:hypothetical protein